MCFLIFNFLYYTFLFCWLSFFLATTSFHTFPLSESSKNHYFVLFSIHTVLRVKETIFFCALSWWPCWGCSLKACVCEWHIYSNCDDRFQRKRKNKRKKAFLGQSRNFLLVGHPSFFSNKLVFLHQQRTQNQNQNQPFNSSKTT